MSKIFVNLEMKNTDSIFKPCILTKEVTPYVMKSPQDYEIAVDRFSLHQCLLPVYEDKNTLIIKIVRKGDNNVEEQKIDFSGVKNSDDLIFDRQHVINAINTSLSNLSVLQGVDAGNVPKMLLNTSSNKLTFDYSSHPNFGNEFLVHFNQPLFSLLDFTYTDVSPENTFFLLDTPNTGSITTNTPVLFSPVDKLYIKSSDMPVVSEFSGSSARDFENILTDFEFAGQNFTMSTTVSFSSTENGIYRFHSMVNHQSFRKMTLSFHYKTFSGSKHPIYLLPTGAADVKLFFNKVK